MFNGGGSSTATNGVIIPDDTNGSIVRKSLPLKPSMTVREVSKIIAHKLRITNPEDFSLYSLVDGQGKHLCCWCTWPGHDKGGSFGIMRGGAAEIGYLPFLTVNKSRLLEEVSKLLFVNQLFLGGSLLLEININ